MTLKMKLIGMAVLATALLGAQAQAGDEPVLKTRTDRESYSNGVNLARTLKQQGGEINLDVLIKGMKDELMSDKLMMTEEDIRQTIAALEAEQMQKRKQAATARDAMKAKAADEAVKTENAAPNDNSAQGEQGGQIAQNKVKASVANRYEMRRAVKNRAAEMRQKTIEQERQGQAASQGAI
jgi:hypothetical protein